MDNGFVWVDLSTFEIGAARDFYAQLFGWRFQDLGEGYLSCEVDDKATAGLYTMPEKFQQIGMPSFWMSYIKVKNIQQTVELAEKNGAKVEIRPMSSPGGGQVALIRDPSGTGFTCYEGDELEVSNSQAFHGARVWNELHVSDLASVKGFYTEVFGWQIEPAGVKDRYQVLFNGTLIAGIQVTSNDIKGDKEYWGVYFQVESFSKARAVIEESGGEIVTEQPLGGERSLLAYDNQGAAFYLVESTQKSEGLASSAPKWRAILGLFLVAVAVITEMNWVWGVLFLSWVIPDIFRGSTHFLEYVQRNENPITYWAIVGTWMMLSAYLLFI